MSGLTYDYGSGDEDIVSDQGEDAQDVLRTPVAFEAATGADVGAAEGGLLIIGFGKTPEASLKARVIAEATGGWGLAGSVTTAAAPGESVAASASAVYQSTAGTALCICNQPVTMADGYAWAAKLLTAVTPAKVLIAAEFPRAVYRGSEFVQEDTDAPVARSLKTTAVDSDFGVPEATVAALEPPNILDGALAAVVARCQAQKIPAQVIAVYRAGGELDASVFAAFEPLYAVAAKQGVATRTEADVAEEIKAAIKASFKQRGDALIYM